MRLRRMFMFRRHRRRICFPGELPEIGDYEFLVYFECDTPDCVFHVGVPEGSQWLECPCCGGTLRAPTTETYELRLSRRGYAARFGQEIAAHNAVYESNYEVRREAIPGEIGFRD